MKRSILLFILLSVMSAVAPCFADAPAGISTRSVVFNDSVRVHTVYFQTPQGAEAVMSGVPGWLDAKVNRLSDDPTWTHELKLSILSDASVKSPEAEILIRYGKTTEAFHRIRVERVDNYTNEEFSTTVEEVYFDPMTSLYLLRMSAPANAASESDWCKVTVIENDPTGVYARIEVDRNESKKMRETFVQFSPENSWRIHRVRVMQDPSALDISEEEYQSNRSPGVYTTVIEGDFNCTLTTDVAWLVSTWNDADNKLSIRIEGNTSGRVRTGRVTVDMGYGRKKTVIVVQSPYSVGDLYDENGVRGIVYWMDGIHGKIVSLTEGRNVKWCTSGFYVGATSKTDGEANFEKVKQVSGWRFEFPAFAWCDTLGEGWYLPAEEEHVEIYKNLTRINMTLAKIPNTHRISIYYSDHYTAEHPGSKMKKHENYTLRYWTSTEADSKEALARFGNEEYYHLQPKEHEHYVRAIHKF